MKIFYSIILILLLCIIFNCIKNRQMKPAEGTLEISYEFVKSADQNIVPSFQTAIWLQNDKGEYLKTLMVSEYLAYGGYNDTTICTEWIKVADWDNVLLETFDAVTKATPPLGNNTISINCKTENLLPGTYNYCIETHILENYNILYRGKITIGKKTTESYAESVYIPKKHPVSGDVLKNVNAKYQP